MAAPARVARPRDPYSAVASCHVRPWWLIHNMNIRLFPPASGTGPPSPWSLSGAQDQGCQCGRIGFLECHNKRHPLQNIFCRTIGMVARSKLLVNFDVKYHEMFKFQPAFGVFFFFYFLLISFFRLPVRITSLVNLSHSVSWWVICSCASFEAILVHFFLFYLIFYFIYPVYIFFFFFFQLWYFFSSQSSIREVLAALPRTAWPPESIRAIEKHIVLVYWDQSKRPKRQEPRATQPAAQRLPGMPAGSQQEWLNSWC